MDDARVAYEKALDLFAGRKTDEAIESLLAVVSAFPYFHDAYEALGMMYYKSGRIDEAIEWTRRLAELKPDYAMAHTNLSIFYMKKGMKEKAEEEKAKAIVINFSKSGTHEEKS